MWGFGSRKKRIDTLEKYIEELQNSLEEAEVTVATKDEIIKNMLNVFSFVSHFPFVPLSP